MHSAVWMGPWDLEERDPEGVLDELQQCGLTGARLAVAYPGGRLLLPRRPGRKVVDLHPGAVYAPVDPLRFGRLAPEFGPSDAVRVFLAAAGRREFPVYGWAVVCHNDHLGAAFPDCAVENAFGDRYPYALCPANPDVREYAAALCRALGELDGLSGLDLEAVSYLGYEHQSLHDMRGIKLGDEASLLLSLCFCEHCRRRHPSGTLRERVRDRVEQLLNRLPGAPVDPEALSGFIEARRQTVRGLLAAIRQATPGVRLNLRITQEPFATGGRTPVSWQDLEGLADEATLTYFGALLAPPDLPPPAARPIPLHAGTMFHGPDLAATVALLRHAEPDGLAFYLWSLANHAQVTELGAVLRGAGSEAQCLPFP
ncbi:MAG: hypothetical protein IPM24_20990 [Bryobacterales bacterium]|nr:hypothetical protein [Bryobacterales bacterium]